MKQIFIGSVFAASLLWSGAALGAEGETGLLRIAKCEADLWEGVSAVYYLVADSGNLARHAFAGAFHDEVQDFEKALSAFKHETPGDSYVEQQLARIEEHWTKFKASGDALVAQALKGETVAAEALAAFWQTADAIDEHLDAIIDGADQTES